MTLASLARDRRLWIALAIVAAAVAVHAGLKAAGLGHLLSLDTLRQHRATLTGWVAAQPVLSAIVFVVVYAASVAVSLPGATLLTLSAGFLFGPWLGTGLAALGASLGAIAVFLLARTLLGPDALSRLGPSAERLAANIKANAASYLLVLRLAPIFPFFLVNLVPAFCGVGLGTYAITTIIGIIPAGFVYALYGAGLGRILDNGGEISLASVLTPEISAGLFGLAALALLAIPIRKWLERREAGGTPSKTVAAQGPTNS